MIDVYYYEIWFDGNCIECSADNEYYYDTEDEAFNEAFDAVFSWTDEEGYEDCDTTDFTVEVFQTKH